MCPVYTQMGEPFRPIDIITGDNPNNLYLMMSNKSHWQDVIFDTYIPELMGVFGTNQFTDVTMSTCALMKNKIIDLFAGKFTFGPTAERRMRESRTDGWYIDDIIVKNIDEVDFEEQRLAHSRLTVYCNGFCHSSGIVEFIHFNYKREGIPGTFVFCTMNFFRPPSLNNQPLRPAQFIAAMGRIHEALKDNRRFIPVRDHIVTRYMNMLAEKGLDIHVFILVSQLNLDYSWLEDDLKNMEHFGDLFHEAFILLRNYRYNRRAPQPLSPKNPAVTHSV
ncbi:hypothetical protein PCE1_001386 [Barthelona sp. PCE]